MKTHFSDVPIADLDAHPDTPSLIEQGDYKHLAARLRQEDFLEPLLVIQDAQHNRKVVDGHLRLKAAAEAGFDTVPVLEVTADEGESDQDLEILALTQMLNETTRPISKNRKAEGIQRLCELERVGDNDRSQRAVADRLGMSEGSLRNWLNRAWLLSEADAGRTSHTREEIEALSQQAVRTAVAALQGDEEPSATTEHATTEKPGHSGLERTVRIIARENPGRLVEALQNAVNALQEEGIDLTQKVRLTADEEPSEASNGDALVDFAGFNRLIGYHYGNIGSVSEIDTVLADAITEECGESMSPSTVQKIRQGKIMQPTTAKLGALAKLLGPEALTKAGRDALKT